MLSMQNICKSYGKTIAVKDASIEVRKGEFVVIVGPNGSGKTTLLSIIAGIVRPDSGRLCFGDTDMTSLPENGLRRLRAGRIGLVFQSPNLLDNLTVLENILLPAVFTAGDAVQRAELLAGRISIKSLLDKRPDQISGGEQRKAAIARSLINNPSLLLVDEPTADLDNETTGEIMKIFKSISGEGKTVLMATHDTRTLKHAKRILRMEHGRVKG